MTGFGAAAVELAHGRVVAEIRTVNARALDVRVRAPEDSHAATLWIEQAVRRALRRGRCEVVLRRDLAAETAFDLERASATFEALRALAEKLGLAPPGLDALLALPGALVTAPADAGATRAAEGRALDAALEALDRDRAREGEKLAEDLRARCALVGAALARIQTRHAGAADAARARLRERAARAAVELDPSRLEAEVLLLCERADFSEELHRLGVHRAHLVELLSDGASEDAGGRRLDFLLQEMAREAGTLAAKAQDGEVARAVVEVKVELERMREQVQNVE